MECWDWDGSGNDGYIGEIFLPLEPLKNERECAEWLELHDREKRPVVGHDGSKSIINVKLERDFADIRHDEALQAGKETCERSLDCTSAPWESSARGIMFDIDNKSNRPIRITQFHSVAATCGQKQGGQQLLHHLSDAGVR